MALVDESVIEEISIDSEGKLQSCRSRALEKEGAHFYLFHLTINLTLRALNSFIRLVSSRNVFTSAISVPVLLFLVE